MKSKSDDNIPSYVMPKTNYKQSKSSKRLRNTFLTVGFLTVGGIATWLYKTGGTVPFLDNLNIPFITPSEQTTTEGLPSDKLSNLQGIEHLEDHFDSVLNTKFGKYSLGIDSLSDSSKYAVYLNLTIPTCDGDSTSVLDTKILNRYNRPVQAIDTSLISNYEQKIKTLNEALGRVKHSASSWRNKYNSASHSADAWKNKYNSLKASTDSIKNSNKYLPQKVPKQDTCKTCDGYISGNVVRGLRGGRK